MSCLLYINLRPIFFGVDIWPAANSLFPSALQIEPVACLVFSQSSVDEFTIMPSQDSLASYHPSSVNQTPSIAPTSRVFSGVNDSLLFRGSNPHITAARCAAAEVGLSSCSKCALTNCTLQASQQNLSNVDGVAHTNKPWKPLPTEVQVHGALEAALTYLIPRSYRRSPPSPSYTNNVSLVHLGACMVWKTNTSLMVLNPSSALRAGGFSDFS